MITLTEIRKLSAFMRRDLRIMLSYRAAALGGLLGIVVQAVVFSFIGKLVDPARLPTFGGAHATYMEFVTIGIGLNMIVVLMLHQLALAIRSEQTIGTLESLLTTPTRVGTIQAGSAAFQLLWVPLRMAVFVGIIALVFGLDLQASGVLPAVVLLIGFLPLLWGIGLASAAAVLTFRRGAGAVTTGGSLFGLASGAFFPLSLLPHWLGVIAAASPLAVALLGLRNALLGGTGWTSIGSDLLQIVPMSVVALVGGMVAFRLALRRERRLGTLGLY